MRIPHGQHLKWTTIGFLGATPALFANNPYTTGLAFLSIGYGLVSAVDWKRDIDGKQPLMVQYIPGIQ